MGLPYDPDLEPVAAAKAHLASQAAAQPAQRQRPVIAPANPEAWSALVSLDSPLIVDGERVAQLTLRRVTGRQLADLVIEDDSEVSLNARARALICGVHVDVLEALEGGDAMKVATACRPFLPAAIVDMETAAIEAMAADELDHEG